MSATRGTTSVMNEETAEFVVYLVNAVANQSGLYPSRVYAALDETGCIGDYLVPFYDVLHTMGTRALVEDILKYVRVRGAKI